MKINTRKTIILFALLLLCAATGKAQRIKTENVLVDFGQVEYFRPTTAVFKLKNIGKKPLSIYKVDTGCDCSEASYPTGQIGAGEEFTVKVTYDSRMMGHFNKIIEVFSNADNSPEMLEMRGIVVEKVEDYIGDFPFQLGHLTADCNAIEFDDVHLGEVIEQRFHVYNPTDKAVEPQIMHLPSYLKAEVSPSSVAPSHSSEVIITLDSRLMHDYGYEKTHIYLGSRLGERVSAGKQIDVSLTLLPPVQVLTQEQKDRSPVITLSDTEVRLPTADGRKKSAVISIQNTGKSRLEIYSMRILAEGFRVNLNKSLLVAGETAKLKITLDPKRLKDIAAKPRLTMITNDPEQPKINIDIDLE